MSWIKLLLGLITIAFCTLLGYLAAEKYRARRTFYRQFYLFHSRFLNELNYARRPLNAFLNGYTYRGDFQKTVEHFLLSHEIKADFPYLKEDERQFLREYFEMLGRGDAHSQSGYFSEKNNELVKKKELCEKEAKTYGELDIKLGLLFGLAFVILII